MVSRSPLAVLIDSVWCRFEQVCVERRNKILDAILFIITLSSVPFGRNRKLMAFNWSMVELTTSLVGGMQMCMI